MLEGSGSVAGICVTGYKGQIENEENNEQIYREKKKTIVKERNFAIYNMESGAMPRDET